MVTASFQHHDLELLNPSFDSPLVDVLTELEHLRRYRLDDSSGSTPSHIFAQLRDIFHLLESLSSARIEGNHTTLSDYVESQLEEEPDKSDQILEISNIEMAMSYIEESINQGDSITETFIRELHTLTVNNLIREGDPTPGRYRDKQVWINGSSHKPPAPIQVPSYMAELVRFVNQPTSSKYDLMKVALAHHRFGWIHPFSNGNGRVVRLFTYALLIKYGFNVTTGGGVLNPTAVFCNDRNKYYENLSHADTGEKDSLEKWCTYVLTGILDELKKVEKLKQYDWLKKNILLPALSNATQRQGLTATEARVVAHGIEHKTFRSSDLDSVFDGLTSTQRTYQIRKLNEQSHLISPIGSSRTYQVVFRHPSLLRGIIGALRNEGFVPAPLDQTYQHNK